MARPSAASSRMLPSDSPENTRPRFSVSASRPSIDLIAEMAAKRTLLSASFALSVSGSSTLLMVGDEVSASALTAARRAAGSALPRLAWAYASLSKALILSSVSFSSARASSGAISGLTLLCSFCAEASRTRGSSSNSLSAASALASSPRIRLLTVTDSGLSGVLMALPVAASNALSPSTMTTLSPAR